MWKPIGFGPLVLSVVNVKDHEIILSLLCCEFFACRQQTLVRFIIHPTIDTNLYRNSITVTILTVLVH